MIQYSSSEGKKRANARRSGWRTYTLVSGLLATAAALGVGLIVAGEGKNPVDGWMGLLDKGARYVVEEWMKSVKG